jgi:hypothetical protein
MQHVKKMKAFTCSIEKSRKSCSIERISKLSHGFMVFHVMKMKLSQVLQLRCSAGEASDLRLGPFP